MCERMSRGSVVGVLRDRSLDAGPGGRLKHGSLSDWHWHIALDSIKATYRATKPKSGDDFNVSVMEQVAQRTWPRS